jgi:Xaa-Pro aminopeptidase
MAAARGTGGSGAKSPLASRIKRLRAKLARAGHDAMLVTIERDIRYLTGFIGEASCLIVTAKRLICISDFRFEEERLSLRGLAEVVMRKGSMPEAQREVIAGLKPASLAIQAEAMSIDARATLAKAVGARRVRDTVGIIAELRIIKDEIEVGLIKKAAKIQQDALLATLPTIKAGQTEAAIAARLEFECRVRGAEGMSFGTIVAAGANGSKPHYRAGNVKTAKGRPLLIDWGCVHGGYCSDMTRTFSLGAWPAKVREIYGITLEAHLAGIAAVRAGATCAEVDRAARSVIDRAGYGERFGHGLGHGIGLDIHEAPRLFKTVDRPLEPGMVVTIEPGIYLPGVGGVRIEDDILVTPKGGRNLCSLPKDIQWATLNG